MFLGYVISKFLWGKAEGSVGRLPNFRFEIGKTQISIHHWMGFLVAILLLILFKIGSTFLSGICLGGLVHGLTYKDRFKIIN